MRRAVWALAAPTVLAAGVCSVWAITGAATMRSPATLSTILHLPWTHHPLAAYAVTAAAPTGNGWALWAVLAVIYGTSLLVAGWRNIRRGERKDPE